MKKLISFIITVVFALSVFAEPQRIIFDTDMGNDIDDAIALAMLIEKHKSSDVNLLAVLINKDNPYAPVYADIIQNFYDFDCPIGIVKDGKTKDDGRFTRAVAELKKPNGKLLYPRTLCHTIPVPSASDVLREQLEASPDNSIVYVSIGFSTNIARFLEVPAQSGKISNLDLFTKKVKYLSIMAGEFKEKKDAKGFSEHKEYNVCTDVDSFRKMITICKTPIIFSGFEIGLATPYPQSNLKRDFPSPHPVSDAYAFYVKNINNGKHDRPSWDETAVLYALDNSTFDLSPKGTVYVDERGGTKFVPSENGLHQYLKFKNESDAPQKVIKGITDTTLKRTQRVNYKGSASHRR